MNQSEAKCVVRLDRLQIVADARYGERKLPTVEGYQVVRDSFVRCQTRTVTYARCRQLRHRSSETQVFWQYRKQKGWLRPWKITFVPNDRTGLLRKDMDPILAHCRDHRLLLVELAFDFNIKTGLDRDFVRRRGVFGKSRLRNDIGNGRDVYYGSRKSIKFVRCYQKSAVNGFRI